MKQKTLFQGFCFPSFKHEGTRRKRFTAWECSGSPWLWVLYHMAVRIFPQWKRLWNLYVWYLSSIQVLRGKNGLLITFTFCSTQRGSVSAVLCPELYLCLCSTGFHLTWDMGRIQTYCSIRLMNVPEWMCLRGQITQHYFRARLRIIYWTGQVQEVLTAKTQDNNRIQSWKVDILTDFFFF